MGMIAILSSQKGDLSRQEAWNNDGRLDVVRGCEMVACMQEQGTMPALVVCEPFSRNTNQKHSIRQSYPLCCAMEGKKQSLYLL